MLWAMAVLALSLSTQAAEAGGAKPKATPLEDFVQKAVSECSAGLVPGILAKKIEVPADAPACNVEVLTEQTSDNTNHLFQVLIETDTMKPLGLVLNTSYQWPGHDVGYMYHASLGGKLYSAVSTLGKRDEAGNAVRGSGVDTREDVNSPAIKKRFQHELDLWLKRAYLKKEWRTAEFSEGKLKSPEPGSVR